MATIEAGHHASRIVIGQDGNLWVNGAAIYNTNGDDVSSMLGQVPVLTKGADYTLTAADSGKLIISTAVDLTFTLPSTADGLVYTVLAGIASTTTGLSLSPAAADQIIGNGFTAADDKDAINTAGTDVLGDLFQVVGDGSAGWYITNVIGTWARET